MLKRLKFLILVSLLLNLVICPSSYSANLEWYVDDATGDDTDDGTTEALAWKTIQKALDTFTRSGGADEDTRINIKNTNIYVIETTVDADTTTGDGNNHIIVQGYTTTIGDGGIAILDCDDGGTQAVNCIDFDTLIDFYIWTDLQMQQSSAIVFDMQGDNSIMEGCIIDGGTDGIFVSADNIVLNTEVKNSSDDGIDFSSANTSWAMYCYVHDITDNGITGATISANVLHNIVDTTGDLNIFNGRIVVGSTLYNSTTDDNYRIGSDVKLIINNIFDTASSSNVDIPTSTSIMVYGFNNLRTNGGTDITQTGTISLNLGGAQTLDPGFTNAPNQNFSIGANLDDLGFPATYKGSSTSSHFEIGAVMFEETAGAGGTTSYGFIQ